MVSSEISANAVIGSIQGISEIKIQRKVSEVQLIKKIVVLFGGKPLLLKSLITKSI